VSVAFRPDGRSLAMGTRSGLAVVIDVATLHPVGPAYRHDTKVACLAFSPDGRLLATGEEGGGVHLREMPEEAGLGTPLVQGNQVNSLQFTRDGRRLLAGSRHGARFWEVSTGRPAGAEMVPELEFEIESTVLSPDGRSVVTGGWSGGPNIWTGRVDLWDAAAGRHLAADTSFPGIVFALAFRPGGSSLVVYNRAVAGQGASPAGSCLWDLSRAACSGSLLGSLAPELTRLTLSPDGRALLLGCRDGTARFWDVARDRQLGAPLPHAGAVMAVAYSPDGRRALTGSRDGTARLWDVALSELLVEPLRHEAEVGAVAFSPDGSILLTGSLDGTGQYWDAMTGHPLGPPLRHAGGVTSAAYAPDGRSAATGGMDHTVRLWRTPAPPATGDAARVSLWVEALTEMEMNDRGALRALSAADVRRRREELDRLGGPPL
jgi:WD40 repeat protein